MLLIKFIYLIIAETMELVKQDHVCKHKHIAILGGRKKEAKRILKRKELGTQKESMWNVKPKVIPRNRKHLRITPTIPEQHTGKARRNNPTGHGTHTVVSTGVKAHNMQHGK